MILEIPPHQVIANCRAALGLPDTGTELDDALLSGLLRHCASILCPCSRATLRTELVNSLSYLADEADSLADRLERLVDDLIVVGDLLELADVSTDDPAVKGTWVFAAPPSFIARPSGAVFVAGVAPDQDAFLPGPIAARLQFHGCTRQLLPEPDEDLPAVLKAAGLQELPESVWLKAPRLQTADSLVAAMERRLGQQAPCGPVNGLEILDPARKVTYYRGRWTQPAAQTGTFVARRPQEFGAPIWCFAELADGAPQHILDLPSARYRWRGCDAAWHLQMAIDQCRGEPQRYRRRDEASRARFDFFSPLPLWAQRRLMIFGRERPRESSLLAYEMPMTEVDEEERYLRECLWMTPIDGSDDGGKGECKQ